MSDLQECRNCRYGALAIEESPCKNCLHGGGFEKPGAPLMWQPKINAAMSPTLAAGLAASRLGLSSNAADRKAAPMARGLLDYFPAALAEVARTSQAANEQHNPGQPMHWAKEKSTDHADCLIRHLADRGTMDGDGLRHSAKVAWRALALLQIELEAEDAKQRNVATGPGVLPDVPPVAVPGARPEPAKDDGRYPFPTGVVPRR